MLPVDSSGSKGQTQRRCPRPPHPPLPSPKLGAAATEPQPSQSLASCSPRGGLPGRPLGRSSPNQCCVEA